MRRHVPQLYEAQNLALVGNWQEVAAKDYATFLTPCTFQWFATFTFKEAKHPESADKAFRVWCNIVNRQNHGKRWRDKSPGGITWVRALEWQKRDVLHYHVLISGLKQHTVSSAQWAESVWLHQLECGFARIDLIKGDQKKVINYCAKYICKDGELDYSDNFAQSLTEDWINEQSLAIARPRSNIG